MSLASIEMAPAAKWPWLDRIVAARSLLILALLMGLLSFAAVADVSVKCSDEPIYLTTVNGNRLMLEDGSGFLISEQKQRKCRLTLGNAFAIAF